MFETLEETLGRFRRHEFELVEHKPPRELVAAYDIVRIDAVGRKVVACPAGQVPHSELQLTDEERASLVKRTPPKPQGYMNPGHGGFTPEGVVVGHLIEE